MVHSGPLDENPSHAIGLFQMVFSAVFLPDHLPLFTRHGQTHASRRITLSE